MAGEKKDSFWVLDWKNKEQPCYNFSPASPTDFLLKNYRYIIPKKKKKLKVGSNIVHLAPKKLKINPLN